MKKLYLFIILVFTGTTTALSQKVDSETTLSCIREGVIEFYIEIDRMDKTDDIKNSYNNVGIIEILENKKIGFDTNGIYRITNFSSHRVDYLLLKKDKKYKILSLINLTPTFNDITHFLEELNYSEKKKLDYLSQVIQEIKTHQNNKWQNSTKPKEQEWVLCE